jgi:hypothetical protein
MTGGFTKTGTGKSTLLFKTFSTSMMKSRREV